MDSGQKPAHEAGQVDKMSLPSSSGGISAIKHLQKGLTCKVDAVLQEVFQHTDEVVKQTLALRNEITRPYFDNDGAEVAPLHDTPPIPREIVASVPSASSLLQERGMHTNGSRPYGRPRE